MLLPGGRDCFNSTALYNENNEKTKKKKKYKKMEHLKKWLPYDRGTSGPVPPPAPASSTTTTVRTGHDGKSYIQNDTGSLRKIHIDHSSCPPLSPSSPRTPPTPPPLPTPLTFFSGFVNECRPVSFLKKEKNLCLNCPSTGLCWFYTFLFYYNF